MRFALALLLCVLAPSASAQAPGRPPVAGTKVGHYAASQGSAAWDNVAVADWASAGPYTIAATDRVAELTVVNTDAANHLYVLLRTSAAEATTAAIEVRAGAALTLDTWGQNVQIIAVRGSAVAATTFRLTSIWSAP